MSSLPLKWNITCSSPSTITWSMAAFHRFSLNVIAACLVLSAQRGDRQWQWRHFASVLVAALARSTFLRCLRIAYTIPSARRGTLLLITLYENIVTAFTYKQLMDGNLGKAKDTYKSQLEEGGNDICREWIDTSDADRTESVDRFMQLLPALRIGAQYSTKAGKLLFLPYMSSVFESVYYALVRFVSVDA